MTTYDLNTILDDWDKDSRIGSDLSEASTKTPLLHAKYLRLYSEVKLRLRMQENNQKKLLKAKWLYYNGKMPKEDIDKRGWAYDPFDGMSKPLKGDMDYFYESDDEIVQSEDKIQYYKNMLETLKEILNNITWRHQTLRNAIEYKKFESGM
jgi:hypothetical protein